MHSRPPQIKEFNTSLPLHLEGYKQYFQGCFDEFWKKTTTLMKGNLTTQTTTPEKCNIEMESFMKNNLRVLVKYTFRHSLGMYQLFNPTTKRCIVSQEV